MINNINNLTKTLASISGEKTGALKAADTTASQQKTTANKAVKSSIDISSQAQFLNRMEVKIKDLPDINEARIEPLRNPINQGTYEINDLSIAQRIIDLEIK